LGTHCKLEEHRCEQVENTWIKKFNLPTSPTTGKIWILLVYVHFSHWFQVYFILKHGCYHFFAFINIPFKKHTITIGQGLELEFFHKDFSYVNYKNMEPFLQQNILLVILVETNKNYNLSFHDTKVWGGRCNNSKNKIMSNNSHFNQ
jgi:hypothetical protein